MTTKHRIISGFLCIIALLAVVSVVGYKGISSLDKDIIDYGRLSRMSTLTSDAESSLFQAMYYLARFIATPEEGLKASSKSALQNSSSKVKDSLNLSQNPEHKARLESIITLLGKQDILIDAIAKDTEEVKAIYSGTYNSSYKKVIEGLEDITLSSQSRGRHELTYLLNPMWVMLNKVSSSIDTHYTQGTLESSEEADEAFSEAIPLLERLIPLAITEEEENLISSLERNLNLMKNSFDEIKRLKSILTTDIEQMRSFRGELTTALKGISSTTENLMIEAGQRATSDAASTKKNMIIFSGIGILLGIVAAWFIVLKLIRVLSYLSRYTCDLAEGDFSRDITIKEGGEFGEVIDSLRQLPKIFIEVISKCNEEANIIAHGNYRERLDIKAFKGSYGDMARAINSVSDSYTRILDALPVGIQNSDETYKVVYTNIAVEKLRGNTPVTLFSERSISMDASHGDSERHFEKSFHNGSRNIEADVYAQALRDSSGIPVGVVEIVSDITEIKERQNIVTRVAAEAFVISDRVAAASEQLAAQVEQVTRGAEIQHERIETTASAMNQMNSTVMEVAKNASQASEQSEETRSKASDGATIVNKVVEAINAVNQIASRLHINMQGLGTQADSIGGVMNVISDIADQTNLLALNAAIEAARAGEAGRGFAVVADEVRKLAEKTMEATREVGESITSIQSSANTNILEVQGAVTSIGQVAVLATSSGEALSLILRLASETSSVVASIATAAEEQSAASEEVNRSVEEINRLVSETTIGMVQSAAAVQELSRTAQELRAMMQGLS